MRRLHFQTFRPICPTCRSNHRSDQLLQLAHVFQETDDDVVSGLLLCPHHDCRREYPIFDGIPVLLTDLRSYVGSNLTWIRDRGYGSAEGFGALESLIGDCCGPGSPLDATRQQLSSYGWSHWGDLACESDFLSESGHDRTAGSVARLVEEIERVTPDSNSDSDPRSDGGPGLDLGCGAGRTTFEMARRAGHPCLGIDMNWPLLRMARQALSGTVRMPLRRVGMVYDEIEIAIDASMPSETVDFWACDAANLPFSDATVSNVLGLNLLDSTTDPLAVVQEIGRVCQRGAHVSLACPYDWSPAATPVESWIGGHSQRGDHRGASEPVLYSLLGPGSDLESLAEVDDIAWPLRLHERATMDYRVHLVVARALGR